MTRRQTHTTTRTAPILRKRPPRSSLTVAALSTALLLVACASDTKVTSTTGTGGSAGGSAARLPQGAQEVTLDPTTFTPDITNPYWPMKPGTRWTSREVDQDGSKFEAVTVVTTQTKKMTNGITARVVRDTLTQDGNIVEDTIDWYAQDADGNIWYLGEKTAEFDGTKITSTKGSFEVGVDRALAGIIVPGHPTPGTKYREEYLKGLAEDNGEILSTKEMAETPYGTFKDAMLVKDTATIEPDVLEYKLYAKGVGPVLVIGVAGGSSREELVKVDQAPATAGTGPLGSPNR